MRACADRHRHMPQGRESKEPSQSISTRADSQALLTPAWSWRGRGEADRHGSLRVRRRVLEIA